MCGKDGWKADFHLFEIIMLLPDFVEAIIESPVSILKQVVGKFHLGQLYDMKEL